MSIVRVTGGVDTHADFHVAAAVDHNGGVLGIESFPTNEAGYGSWCSSPLILRGFAVVAPLAPPTPPVSRRTVRTDPAVFGLQVGPDSVRLVFLV